MIPQNMVKTLGQAFAVSEETIGKAIQRSYDFMDCANHSAVYRVLEKAARGEEITVVAIGGSITAGAKARVGNNAQEFTEALSGENCWFNRVVDYLRARFPQTNIKAVNAGIGATPSFLGTFRLEEMVLTHKPDLVTVEFSVNDTGSHVNLLGEECLEAYESVVRRCLTSGAAVIQVFMNDETNAGMQAIHSQVAKYYQLPSISYHNAVYPNGELICDWVRLSPDDVHPNNAGHALLGLCITNYLDELAKANITACESPAIPEAWMFADTFHNVFACYAHSLKESASENFTFMDDASEFQSRSWKGVLISNGEGTIQAKLPKGVKRVWVQYFHNPGSFETEWNGQMTNCNTVAVGWPRAMWHRVYTGAAVDKETTLTIKTHKKGRVVFIGVLASF